MPFPKKEIAKALEKYVADYKSGKLTEEQRQKWWNEGGKPYDKFFVDYIWEKCTPIKGHEHINRFDTTNFFYKINKLMNCGFMAEYDKIGVVWRSEEMFELMRQIGSITSKKARLMDSGKFSEGEIEYLQGLPDWVDASQKEYTKLYYKAPYFKKQIKTVEDFLWVNWI